MGLAGTQDMTMVIRARNLSRKALGTVSGDLGRINAQTKTLSRTMGTLAAVGRRTLFGVGIAAVAGTAAAVTSYVSFDAKMTESLAIMGDVNQGMRDEMERTARTVGTTTTFSANQAAEAYFFLASAGFTAEQSIAAMPQVALFAQAGMFDLALATDLATDAQSALSMTVPDAVQNLENMTRVTDVLVGANTLANASVEQFSQALINKAAAAGTVANKSIEEITATLAVFADRGFKGQVAGEMYSRMLKGLQINALKNADAFAKHNIEVFDSQGNMRNTAAIVGELTNALSDLSDKQKTQALLDLGFSARQQDVFKILLGTSEQMAKYEAELYKMGGTTQVVADKQLQSIQNQFALFTSRIKDVFIGLGKKLLPIMTRVVKAMSSWADKTLPKLVKAIEKIAKAVGEKLVMAFSFVRDLIREAIDWWRSLSPEWKRAIKFGGMVAVAFVGVATAISILVGVLGLLLSPIVLLIATVAALAAGIKYAWDNFEWFREAIGNIASYFTSTVVPLLQTGWDKLKEVAEKAAEFFHDKVLPVLITVASWLGRNLVKAFRVLRSWILNSIDWWSDLSDEWKRAIGTSAGVAASLLLLVWVFGRLFAATKWIGGILVGLRVGMAALSGPVGIVIAVVAILAGAFVYLWSRFELFRETIRETGRFWMKYFVNPLVTGWNWVVGAVRSAIDWFTGTAVPAFKGIWGSIVGWFSDAVKRISDVIVGINTAVAGVIEFLEGIFTGDWKRVWTGIKDFVRGIWEAITAIAAQFMAGLWAVLKVPFAIFKAGWELAWGGIKLFFVGVWGAIKGAAAAVFGWIVDKIGWLLDRLAALKSAFDSFFGVGGASPSARLGAAAAGAAIGRIPRQAKGGETIRRGLSIVGDAGPELLDLNRGARVVPLDRRPPRMARDFAGASGTIGRGGGGDTIVNVILPEGIVITAEDLAETVRRVLILKDADGSVGLSAIGV